MSILVSGLNIVLPLSMGTCNLIVNIVQIIIGTIFEKSYTSVVSLVSVFLGSYSIDLAYMFINPSDLMSIRIIYMLVGGLLYCIAIGMQLAANIGYSSLDIFIFGLKKKFNIKNYHTIRWIVDIGFIVVGMLLGGEVGIGTIILMLFSGIAIEKFKALFEKII